jgi:hypothetical protein
MAFWSRWPLNEALSDSAAESTRINIRQFVSRSFGLAPGHESWAQIEQGQIHGLVSVHTRPGADIWDIDQLMVPPVVDSERVVARLLEHLCGAAVEEGIQKIFLRLQDDSPWLSVARQSGFMRYTSETVFVAPQLGPIRREVVPGLRPRRPADHQSLFQLYCAAVPVQIRQIEALTLQEWRWIDDWGLRRVTWQSALSRRRRDFVLQTDTSVDAWARVDVHRRFVTIIADPRRDIDLTPLCQRSLSELVGRKPVTWAVREYQPSLESFVSGLGFQFAGTHALLARMLAVRIPEGRLVPARV